MKRILMMGVIALMAAFLLLVGCQPEGGDMPEPGAQGPGGEEPPMDEGPVGEIVGEQGTGVAATVNGEEIQQAEIDDFVQQMQMQGQQVDESMVLNQLIAMELLFQEADKRGIEVSEQEAEEELEEMLEVEGMTLQEIKDQLGPGYESFLDEQRENMKIHELAREEGDISVTDEEIEEHYEENKEFMGDASLEEIEPQIEMMVEQQKMDTILNELVADLEAEADIEIEGAQTQPQQIPIQPEGGEGGDVQEIEIG